MERDDADNRPLPWFRLQVATVAMTTSGMDPELFGIYMRAIMYQWINGRVPQTQGQIMANLGGKRAWDRWEELEYFFPDGQAEWLEQEREAAMRLHQARSQAGRRGARQRWGAENHNGESQQ